MKNLSLDRPSPSQDLKPLPSEYENYYLFGREIWCGLNKVTLIHLCKRRPTFICLSVGITTNEKCFKQKWWKIAVLRDVMPCSLLECHQGRTSKLKATGFPEILPTFYQNILWHIPEHSGVHSHAVRTTVLA
jgi:hypothetical protein